jgi:hypothetical protein
MSALDRFITMAQEAHWTPEHVILLTIILMYGLVICFCIACEVYDYFVNGGSERYDSHSGKTK